MVDWLIKGEPRKVQIEALRRSYYGEARWDRNPDLFEWDDDTATRVFRDGPARGWGHLLQMRLGKTPVFLNEFELFRRDHDFKWSIILTPNKFKLDWPLEAERFGLSIPAFAFDSTTCDDAQWFINKNSRWGGLIAVNYEALFYEKNRAILQSVIGPKTYIGADESITIKKFDGAYTKPAIDFAKECGARRILSGKPISQGPHDMWAQLRFIGALDGFVYQAFRGTFCKMGGFQAKKVVGVKSENEPRFHEIMDQWTWAARRVDWLKGFGTDYIERKINMLPDQERLYRQMQTEFMVELADGTIVEAEQIITKLIKMQQIASGFIIDADQNVHHLMSLDKNPKIREVKAMLENEIESKVLIFCHFTASIQMLEKALAEYQPATIRGRASNESVIASKTRFNGDPACRVMIGQEQAIRYGHTLMGTPDDPCYNEIFFENNYSLNDRSQCEERPQGEGQAAPITVWDMYATAADMAPIRALQLKEDVAALMLRYARDTGILPPRPALKA